MLSIFTSGRVISGQIREMIIFETSITFDWECLESIYSSRTQTKSVVSKYFDNFHSICWPDSTMMIGFSYFHKLLLMLLFHELALLECSYEMRTWRFYTPTKTSPSCSVSNDCKHWCRSMSAPVGRVHFYWFCAFFGHCGCQVSVWEPKSRM